MKHAVIFGLILMSQAAFAGSQEHFKLIDTQGLLKLEKERGDKLVILDANNEKTRKEEGVIPGAKLLTSYKTYDLDSEVHASKDSTLVFYCANTQCQASHAAAERAYKNGYKDVNVMSDGIQGWKKKGQKSLPVAAKD